MKVTTIIISILIATSSLFAYESTTDKDKQITELKKEISSLNEQLLRKKQEVNRLKNLLKKNGIEYEEEKKTYSKDLPYKVIDKEIFGIKLGEHIEDVKKRFKILDEKQGEITSGYTLYTDSEDIKKLFILTYKDAIFNVSITFDFSKNLDFADLEFEALVINLEKKYELINKLSFENSFSADTKIDDSTIDITLIKNKSTNGMSLLYWYEEIREDAMKERYKDF